MSVHVSAYVWEHSVHKGTELLLLLSIADMAHPNGCAFPSVATMAKRIRMSSRNTQRVLQKLESSGELRIKKNAGPNGTHLVQVVMNTTLPLFNAGGDDKLSPDKLTGDSQRHEGVTKTHTRGDTVTSPEPKEQKKNRIAAGASPSPVAACFKAYAEGIKANYNADYPPSAKANGQLGNVVARIGAEPAVAVVKFYVASRDPWYSKVRHSLDFLVRDCERMWLDVQVLSGGAKVPPKTATAALIRGDGEVARELGDRPLADAETVARAVMKEYGGLISRLQTVKYVGVRIGSERRTFALEELRA